MDLFPTNLVDNLVIMKTQTANLPGDWAGAYISVDTKDFPEQFQLNYSSTVGVNDQTTFQQVLGSNKAAPTGSALTTEAVRCPTKWLA